MQEPWVNDPMMQDARIVSTVTADAQHLRPTYPLAETMWTGGYMGKTPENADIIRWGDVE